MEQVLALFSELPEEECIVELEEDPLDGFVTEIELEVC